MVAKCVRVEIIGDKEKPLSSDWRKDKFLWKPKAEHYDGVVVLTNPIGKATSVVTYNAITNKKIKTLRFRPHRPTDPTELPVGDAWADYSNNGAWYKKTSPKGILVKVAYKDKTVRTFKLSCPQKRSDGK